MCDNAAGTWGATVGGVACLFAVPCRMDRYMFFPDVTSTSPNFCRGNCAVIQNATSVRYNEFFLTFCGTSFEAELSPRDGNGGDAGSSYSCGGDAVEDVLRGGGRGGGAAIAAGGFDLNIAAAAATRPMELATSEVDGCCGVVSH